MKQALIITLSALVMSFGQMAFAADVVDARFNFETQTIQVDVAYSGGCSDHHFELKVRNCTRADAMTCVVAVVDHTEADQCRQIVEQTIEVPAADYISHASLADLVIVGDNGSAVHLPLR